MYSHPFWVSRAETRYDVSWGLFVILPLDLKQPDRLDDLVISSPTVRNLH